MAYIERHAEKVLKKLEKNFKVILVTGARQVGKTTLLTNVRDNLDYVNLDDVLENQMAIEDPQGFLLNHRKPTIIDEIQYAPEILRYIKLEVDRNEELAQYYLTGSQKFTLMKGVSESLAGRVGILNLLGLSYREIKGIDFYEPFSVSEKYLRDRERFETEISKNELWEMVFKGGLPVLYSRDADENLIHSTYVSTYIERDVRNLTQVGDELLFSKFMVALAARIGEMLVVDNIASEVGISVATANRWISILQTSNIIYLLQPYATTELKRAIRTPKIYFLDTGLAAYLTRWKDKNSLATGAMSGHYFENFVVVEILKSFYNSGELNPPVYYYRSKDSKEEIDLIIEENGELHPIEIKETATPEKQMVRHFKTLEKTGKLGEGVLICNYSKTLMLDEKNKVVPVGYL